MNARQLIAENIRRARIISKTSISEFSARTKISERKIKEYESGDKFPSIQDLYAISKETKLSLDFFIDHISNRSSTARAQNARARKKSNYRVGAS